jgi:hypothetical protein
MAGFFFQNAFLELHLIMILLQLFLSAYTQHANRTVENSSSGVGETASVGFLFSYLFIELLEEKMKHVCLLSIAFYWHAVLANCNQLLLLTEMSFEIN